ncbi:MAG: hypothetical protein JKY20_04705 [Alphaproteobacteria bacterium]|nr:hypothetical protein [Alphaproteobacteria bacterium]
MKAIIQDEILPTLMKMVMDIAKVDDAARAKAAEVISTLCSGLRRMQPRHSRLEG